MAIDDDGANKVTVLKPQHWLDDGHYDNDEYDDDDGKYDGEFEGDSVAPPNCESRPKLSTRT